MMDLCCQPVMTSILPVRSLLEPLKLDLVMSAKVLRPMKKDRLLAQHARKEVKETTAKPTLLAKGASEVSLSIPMTLTIHRPQARPSLPKTIMSNPVHSKL